MAARIIGGWAQEGRENTNLWLVSTPTIKLNQAMTQKCVEQMADTTFMLQCIMF